MRLSRTSRRPAPTRSPPRQSSKTVSQADAQLATKADLAALRADLQATIVSLERRLIGYLIATVLIVLAAIKYL